MAEELSLDVEPFGPDPKRIQQLSRALLRHEALRRWVKRGRAAVLAVELVEREDQRKRARPRPADMFRATIFDYRQNRTLLVHGPVAEVTDVEVEERGFQPLPSPEEFEEAVTILGQDEGLGSSLQQEELRPYRPVPPMVTQGQPGDGEHRMLAVGLVPTRGTKGHEIVGVDMIDRSVVRFDEGAPQMAAAHNPICGQPNAFQPIASKGTAGQVWVTVSQAGTTLWRFSGRSPRGVFRNQRLRRRAEIRRLSRQACPLPRTSADPECEVRQ